MPGDAPLVHIVRFSTFEVDLRSGELRKGGVRVPLQDQPFKILVRLLEHPGELVTRDALRQDLWAGDTFVDFEHGLNAAIKRLRDALGDSADTPRFVETRPRRGYRFIAPVDGGVASPLALDAAAAHARGTRKIHRLALAAAGLVAAAVVAIGLVEVRRAPVLTDRDTILVADFVNRTGEEVFDGTLRQGLTVQLEQSPFLSVVSRERVQKTLHEMTRPADIPVVEEVAREVCQRSGALVTINGSIAQLGTHYVVGLEAVHCVSGSSVAEEQVEVADREHVLSGLSRAAAELRRRLGESRRTLERFNTPLTEATTASLNALRMFSLAEESRAHEGDLKAEPLYKRAIELDPDFFVAHARLSAVYANTGRIEEMRRASRKADSGRAGVSELERLYIDGRHCISDAGPAYRECYATLHEVWVRTYPRNAVARVNLCNAYHAQGKFIAALDQCRAAVDLAADSYLPYTNLIEVFMDLNRFDDARKIADAALARGITSDNIRVQRFVLAFALHDARWMAIERQALAGQPGEHRLVGRDAEAAQVEGRFTDARRLLARFDQVGGTRFGEMRARLRASMALVEAAAGFATCGDAQAGRLWDDNMAMLAVTAALCGDRARAERLLEPWREVESSSCCPFLVPTRALLHVQAGESSAAARLPAAAPQDLGSTTRYRPPYIRGLVYLRSRDPLKAIAEFQRIIDHRGVDPTSGLYPLAYLQQARAYVLAHDTTRARKSYEQFLTLWQNADADVPILKAAKAEYARLRRPS